MTLKTIVLTFVVLWGAVLMPARAQMPPQPQYRVPASTPLASTTPSNSTPPVQQGVAVDYIWFGNDQINQAVQMIRNNQLIQALEVLDGIAKINMRLPEVHLLKGIAFMQLRDLARAEQAFNTVLAIDRGYLGAYVYLSQIALQKNNPQQVEVYLQAIKAVAMTDDCAEYRFVKNSLRSVPAPTDNNR